MVINEDKITEMIQKEIEQQVQNKLKQIGRQTILDIYNKEVHNIVSSHLENLKVDTLNKLHQQIEFEKDYWKQEVLDMLKERFNDKIDTLFSTDNYRY